MANRASVPASAGVGFGRFSAPVAAALAVLCGTCAALAVLPGRDTAPIRMGQQPRGVIGQALGGVAEAPVPLATRRFMQQFPGAFPTMWNGRVMSLAGVPMEKGQTPENAAAAFVAKHARAFGIGDIELTLDSVMDTASGKFRVFRYTQTIDGTPVDFGSMKVVVRLHPDADHPAHNAVVLASAKLAQEPEGGFLPDAIAADQAVTLVRMMRPFADLKEWSEPTASVYFGEGDFDPWITPVRTWRFVGQNNGDASDRKFTFFVDMATGELVHARSEIYHQGAISGTVRALATPGSGADTVANPPVLTPVPQAFVRDAGVTVATTGLDGTFSANFASVGPFSLSAGVGGAEGGGVAVSVVDADGATLSLDTESSNAPGTLDLLLNETPSEITTAQVNAFIVLTLTRDYFRRYAGPSFTGINPSLPANVNISTQGGQPATCNAFYNGASTNYFRAGGGCNNTAFGSVAAHEYGHHIVNRLGLSQGAFGEGYGDTIGMLLYDDSIVGRNFGTTGGAIRTPDSANIQYPCPTNPCQAGTSLGVHCCGQILGGVVWEIRKNLGARYGSAAGLELARQLHGEWSLLTDGGIGANSAHPDTAIQFLTVDDTDGNLANGTPNYAQIAAAFAAHSIPVPPVLTLEFTFPNGVPEVLAPNTATTVAFNAIAAGGTPAPGTGRLFWRQRGATAYQQAVVTSPQANQYLATIPAQPCGTGVEYYVSAETQQGIVATPPQSGPAAPSTVLTGVFQGTFDDNFETDRGWTVSPGNPAATLGLWTRVDPNPTFNGTTPVAPGDDRSPTGTQCYVTGQGTTTSVGEQDVDNGETILTSPAMDLAGAADARISFWRWYTNIGGQAPNADVFTVEASTDNGATWTAVDVVGPTTPTPIAWTFDSVRLSSFGLTPTSTTRVRFRASDLNTGSVVEAGVDDFVVERLGCPNTCVADVDNGSGTGTPDGGVTIEDLLFYLGVFGLGDARADVDNGTATGTPDGGVTIEDLLYYLQRFESGC